MCYLLSMYYEQAILVTGDIAINKIAPNDHLLKAHVPVRLGKGG